MFNTKKILALLLAMLMTLSLVGCGGNGDPDPSTAPTEPQTEPQTEPSTVDPNLTIHENTFFTVGYNEDDGWVLAEDDIYMYEDGGYVYLRIQDEDGYDELLIRIDASEEDASYFREALYSDGIDLKAYVDGTWTFENIGGLQMAFADDEDGERSFYYRDETAGISYIVDVTDWDHPMVPALLKNITFIASTSENMDPPWPWDGEPFTGGTVSQMVGTYTLTAQFLPMAEPMVTFETFCHDIVVIGDKVYLLSDYVLSQYAYNGTDLTFEKEIPLNGEYEVLEKGADGSIILSNFMEPVIGHDGSAVLFSYEGPDSFTVAPDATWGISWFVSGDDCQKYTFRDGALVGEDFPFAEVDTIHQVNINDDYILVSGSSVEDDEHYVFVYDHSGQLQLQLGGEPGGWGLGSVTFATSTPNGFLALDGNMRELVLWTADGTWIGAVEDGDLFGTSYPWIAAADVAEDGSILIVMSETREDESADEVLVFKLSGF